MNDLTKILLFTGGLVLLANRNKNNQANIGKMYDYNATPWGRMDQANAGVETKNYARQLIGKKIETKKFHLDPEIGTDKFKLAGIEFGGWMKQKDRYSHFAAGMQSLVDLSKVLGVSANKIGRNKKLAIAFGARGKGGFAAAHYEPRSFWTINMTKPWGKGSLAHEYGHFIDNYIAHRYLKNNWGSERSTRKTVNQDLLNGKGVKSLYEQLFKVLYYDDKGQPNEFYKAQQKRTKYYNLRIEVFARTFESYIRMKLKEKGIKNNYLVNPFASDEEPPAKLVKKAEPIIKKILKVAFQ